MSIIDKLPSFAAGIVVSGIAFTAYVNVSAQITRNVVDVCANAEGTLRLVDPGVACQAGERRLRLRQPNIENPQDGDQAQDDKRLSEMQQRVKDLEERAAKGRLLGSRVIAPFEVINEEGYAVFKVEDGYTWFNNASGTPVARVVMDKDGAYFEATSRPEKLRTAIGARGKKASLFVIDGKDQTRVNLGTNDSGEYGLRVYEPNGKLVAGIGQGTAGDGVVTIADKEGHQRAVMYVEPKAGGILDIVNSAGKTVASLFATANANGQMRLFNSAGEPMVEAGVTDANIGVVRTGPAAFHPGVTITGAPTSMIVGKAAK